MITPAKLGCVKRGNCVGSTSAECGKRGGTVRLGCSGTHESTDTYKQILCIIILLRKTKLPIRLLFEWTYEVIKENTYPIVGLKVGSAKLLSKTNVCMKT